MKWNGMEIVMLHSINKVFFWKIRKSKMYIQLGSHFSIMCLQVILLCVHHYFFFCHSLSFGSIFSLYQRFVYSPDIGWTLHLMLLICTFEYVCRLCGPVSMHLYACVCIMPNSSCQQNFMNAFIYETILMR